MSAALASSTGIVRTRKTHFKSRKGCLYCKSRHIKCDESFPECNKCQKHGLICEYAPATSAPSPLSYTLTDTEPDQQSLASSPNSMQDRPANPLIVPSAIIVPPGPLPGYTSPPTNDTAFTIIPVATIEAPPDATTHAATFTAAFPDAFFFELTLANHVHENYRLWSNLYPSMDAMHASESHHATTNQIVMLQSLSNAASYCGASCNNRADADIYRQHALLLHERAHRGSIQMMLEQSQTPDGSESTAQLIYLSLCNRAILADALSRNRDNFGQFIAGLVQLGGSIVFTTGCRRMRDALDLQLLVMQSPFRDHYPNHDAIANMLTRSQLSSTKRDDCNGAAIALSYLHGLLPSHGAPVLLLWIAMVPAGFWELLQQHVPEALVVLAHFGGLMHRMRGWWVFRDAGRFVVKSIEAFLGVEWSTFQLGLAEVGCEDEECVKMRCLV